MSSRSAAQAKTHNNFYRLYDAAMLSVTSYEGRSAPGDDLAKYLRGDQHDRRLYIW